MATFPETETICACYYCEVGMTCADVDDIPPEWFHEDAPICAECRARKDAEASSTCDCGAEKGEGDCPECVADRDFATMTPADYHAKWSNPKKENETTEVKAKESLKETLAKVDGFVDETWKTTGVLRRNVDRKVVHHALLEAELLHTLGDQLTLAPGDPVAQAFHRAGERAVIRAYPTAWGKMRGNTLKQEESRLTMAYRLKAKLEARKAKK